MQTPTVGMQCIVNSYFLAWFNAVPTRMPCLLLLGDVVEVSSVSKSHPRVTIRNPENGVSCGGVPFEIVETMRVKR